MQTEDESPPVVETPPSTPPTGIKQLRFCTPEVTGKLLFSQHRSTSEDNMPLRFAGKRSESIKKFLNSSRWFRDFFELHIN